MTTISERLRDYQQADMDGVMCIVSRQAAEEAAETIDVLVGALAEVRRLLTYPVASEINARGWNIHAPDDAIEYAVEKIDAALALAKGERP